MIIDYTSTFHNSITMTPSNFHQPPPNINRSNAEIMKLNLPSQSSIKKYKIELHLDQPLSEDMYTSGSISHVYRPGDLINGQLFMVPPVCSKKGNEIKFNEITIQLECKLITNAGGGAKTLFTMGDNPSNIPKALVSTTSFPFSFKIPESLLDNTCPHSIEAHNSLPPSFASPRLCSMVFSGTENPGTSPSTCPQFDTYKTTPFNRFCVVYYLTATIAQKISAVQDPYVIFKRILEIPVLNNFEPFPTNILKTPYDIANHYSCTQFNKNQDLVISNSSVLKSKKISIGSLSSSTTIPSPISISSQHQELSIPLSVQFEPTIGPTPVLKLHYTAEITQYVIQSSGCIPAIANPQPLPDDYHVERQGKQRKVVQKIQSVSCLVSDECEWIPDYDDQNILLKTLDIKVPFLGNTKLQPTFHSCLLQNIFILKVKFFNNDEEIPEAANMEKTRSGGSLFGKIGLSKSSAKGSSEKKEALCIDIPVTLLA